MCLEYEKLYEEWMRDVGFSSTLVFQGESWNRLLEWCRENREEFKKSILEQLKESPNWSVQLLDEIYGKELGVKAEGYVGLKDWCNFWVLILENRLENYKKGDVLPYVYKEYDEYKEYLKNNYIPWNPFKEDDPNITFEEFKQGKRNGDKNISGAQ